MKRSVFLLFAFSFLFSGCVASIVRNVRAEGQIKDNILITRAQRQHHFLSVWGKPSRTYSAAASNPSEALNIVQSNAPAITRERGRVYDIWRYDANHCTLVFFRTALEAWQWDEPRKQ